VRYIRNIAIFPGGNVVSQFNTIPQLFSYLQGLGSTVTLDSVFLTQDVLNLIGSSLEVDNDSIEIDSATTTLSNDQQTIYITGTTSLLNMTGAQSYALIQQTQNNDGTERFDLILQIVTPSGWTFGDSFPALKGMQPPSALSFNAGPYLYFSSFATPQAIPVFPSQQPVSPPGATTPPQLAAGLNYYAQLQPAGIYKAVISLITSTTPWFFLYGMITPDPDQPQFDLHAPIDQATTVLDYIPGLCPPWLGVKVAYPASSGGDSGAGAQALLTAGDDPTPALVFYLGTNVTFPDASGGGSVTAELDVVIDPNTNTVQVIIASDETDPLSLADLALALTDCKAADLLTATQPISNVLDIVKLQSFTATFNTSAPILSSLAAQFDTDVLSVGIPNFPTMQLFLDWTMPFGGADSSKWSVVFGGTLDFPNNGPSFTTQVTVPDVAITCKQSGVLNLALSDLNGAFGVDLAIPDDLLQISLSNFTLDIEYQKSYTFSGTLAAEFNIFGVQLLALDDMNVTLSLTTENNETTYDLEFDGNISLGSVTVNTIATITNDPKKDTVFTMHLVNQTVGTMLNNLISLVDPNASLSLGDPWDQILNISLDALVMTVNVSKGSIAVSYTNEINLWFLDLKSITLTYVKATPTTASKVTVSITGSFLGIPIDDSNPVQWDALNEQPPSVPPKGTQIFDLQYAGLGQHITFGNLQNLTTIADVMSAMMASVLPTPTGALPPFGKVGENGSIVFSSDSNWFIGASFTVMETLTLQAVFNDPSLYGIRIALAGEKAGSFAGLDFEILYRKISDTIGVYHIELKLPDAMRNLEFGEVSITLPIVVLDVYTNGNFRIDLGFPKGLDFSNSFCLQIFPFVGYGGFYFAWLDGATSSNVPQITNGDWSPVIEFGLALSIGVGKTIDEGILSGGVSVTVVGILQGVVAWFNPSDNSNKEIYYWIQGTIAITGKLYGSINFGIIQASVEVTAYASITLTIQAHMPILINMSVGVSVQVSLKIIFFTIHFSFSATISASFTIGSQTPTPWIVAGSGSNTMLRANALGTAAPALPRTHIRGLARAMRRARLSAAVAGDPGEWPAIAVIPNAPVPMPLWALPAFSISQASPGTAQAIMLLAANTGPQFDLLMQAMLMWAVNNAVGSAPSITADQLETLYQQIKQEQTIDAAFNYTTLSAFLAANFNFQISPANASAETNVAVFPMIPSITLTDTNGLDVDFSVKNGVTDEYVEKVQAYFELLAVQFQQQNSQSGSDQQPMLKASLTSMATVVFSQYFNMLMSSGVKAAIDLLESFPYTTTSAMSVAQIGTAIGDTALISDPIRVVSPNQDLNVLGAGVFLPFATGVTHQIRSGETLTSVASSVTALGGFNLSQQTYGPTDLVSANSATSGIFNTAETAPFTGIQWTANAGDTLNLISARFIIRGGGTAAVNALPNLNAAVTNLLNLNTSITDPNAQLNAGTVITLTTGPTTTYTSVAGDSLTLIGAYVAQVSQPSTAPFVSALLALPANANLQQKDPTQPQNPGTAIAIPAVTRAFATTDTISNLADTLLTSATVIQTNLTGALAGSAILAPQGVLQTPLAYKTAAPGTVNPNTSADTFSSIGSKLAVQLADLAIAVAPVAGLFASGQPITVSDVDSIAVANLVPNLANQNEWQQAPAMVSRFLCSGLRVPDPADPVFETLSVLDLQNPLNLGGIKNFDGLFAFTGQQYTLPQDLTNYTFTLTSSVPWVTLALGAFPASFSTDQTGQITLISKIDMSTVLSQFQTPTRMALFQMVPPRIAIQNFIPWQAAASPLSGSSTGSPTIWTFPDSLVNQVETSSNTLYELVVARQGPPNSPVIANEAQSYAWATIVDFTITLPVTDGPAVSVANTYVVGGADVTGAQSLQDVYNYLTAPSCTDGATLYLLYSPNSSGSSSSGLASDLVGANTYILETNLSTVTNAPTLMKLAQPGDEDDTATGPGYSAAFSDATNFIALLWQSSITRSGGYYLTYFNQNGNAPLPGTLFGSSSTATVSLVILLKNQLSSKDSTIHPFNNCAVVADNIDTTTSNVFVQPAIYTVQSGDTLQSATANFNTTWNTTYQVSDLANFNSTVPQLLIVGAQVQSYTIGYSDTLSTLIAKFGLAAIQGLAILQPSAPMQVAAGVLIPSTTVPPGTTGFEMVRANPDPNDAQYPNVTGPEIVGSLFNMVGYQIAPLGNFIASGWGLPTMPASAPLLAADGLTPLPPVDNPPFWYYSQSIVAAPFGTTTQAIGSDALPQAVSNPYNGISPKSQVTINLQLQDSYGNVQDLGNNLNSVPVDVGYYDDIVSLGSWPSMALSYTVTGNGQSAPSLNLQMTMQQSRYIPNPGVTVNSSQSATAADLQSYTSIFYQVAQADFKFFYQTTLDTASMATPIRISSTPFTAFATGAWIYLNALNTLQSINFTGDGTANSSVGNVSNLYGVTAAQLLTANQNQTYLSLFASGALVVPQMYVTANADSLNTVAAAANPPTTAANVATMNQTVALAPNAVFTRPAAITVTAAATDSLASAAQTNHASPAGIATANPQLILAKGLVFGVGTASYTTGQTDSFQSIALALGTTIEAVAQANQWLTGIFVAPFQISVADLMSQTADTLESLATLASTTVQTLVNTGTNGAVQNLYPVGTALLVGINNSVVGPSSADTLSTFAAANHVTVAQLGSANASTSTANFINGASVAIPGALHNPAGATYSASSTDTLGSIGQQLGVSTVVIAMLNASTAGLIAGGQTITIGQTKVTTNANTTLFGIIEQLAAAGANVTLAQLATTIESQDGLVVENGIWTCTSFCTYTAGEDDTLQSIAGKFGRQPADIAELNASIPGLINSGVTIKDIASGKTVVTGLNTTLAAVCGQFSPAITISDLAADIASQQNLLTESGLWICTSMLGNANTLVTSGKLADLAAKYNTDPLTLGTANAATIGFLASGVSLSISGVTITTNANETFNSLVNRVALGGVTVTVSSLIPALAATPGLINPKANVVAVPPPTPANAGYTLAPQFPDSIFQITVNVVSTRETNLIDPDFTTNQSVSQSTYGVAPEPDPNNTGATSGYSLADFATLLQTAMPGLQVATGNPVAEGDSVTNSTIWGVNFGSSYGANQINYQFDGASTQYFAIPPLSTSLMAGSAMIQPYTSGKDLGTAASQTFQAVDLDSWLNTFLQAVDLFLTPTYAAGAYAIDQAMSTTYVTDVVGYKQTIADNVAAPLTYILSNGSGGSTSDAVEAMTQQLLLQLGNAFTINTLVQVPVTVTQGSSDPTTAPRLSGKIEIIDPGTGEPSSTPSAFSFSTAKVSMVTPEDYANFMLSVKSPAENKNAKLNLNYVITDMEMPTATTGIGDYQGSSWLKFVIPVTSAQTQIGPVNIPIPLRFYPSPVTLVSQAAAQSYETPASSGQLTDATQLLAWDYNFVYTHDNAEQDTPTVVVQFDTAESANAQNGAPNSAQLQAIFAALAQFIWVWPEVKDDLVTITAGKTDVVAQKAVKALHDVVQGVANAFNTTQLKAAGPFVPQPAYYAYMAEQYSPDNVNLQTLTLTSVNLDGQPAPNTTILWPNVFVTYPAGATERQLTLTSSTSTQAQYAYPTTSPIPASVQFPQRYQLPFFPGPNNTPAPPQGLPAPQTYTFNQANALMHQSGYAGVSIARNLVLVTDGSGNNIPTSPLFIYETPLTNFQSLAVPFIFAQSDIPLPPSDVAPTVGQALGMFLKQMLNGQNTWTEPNTQIEMRIAVAYSYVLVTSQNANGQPTQLGGLVPIALIPNADFDATSDWDWTNPNSVVGQIASVIQTWYTNPDNTPVNAGGSSYVFDITIFAAGGNLQPLIRASTLRYMLPAGSGGV
jgi:LysM repeat protein